MTKIAFSRAGSMTGAYALNALTPEERAAFERELANSQELLTETTELQDTAVLLSGLVDEVEPPDYLRTRIMAAIERTPQLSPAEAAAHRSSAFVRWLRGLGAPFRGPFGWAPPRLLLPVAGAAAAALAVTLVLPATLQHGATSPVPAAIQAASDDTARDITLPGGTTAQVLWSDKLGLAAVHTAGVKLADDQTYQLWVTRDGATSSAGLVQNGTWTPLQAKIQQGDMLRMTVEPQGGSSTPTSKPLFAITA